MDLHAKIMNLPPLTNGMPLAPDDVPAYRVGFRDARHEAAELALEADAEIERLRAALAEMVACEDEFNALETSVAAPSFVAWDMHSRRAGLALATARALSPLPPTRQQP